MNKVIYIAGPYRSDNEYGVRMNIRKAEEAALLVWLNGGVALCPHKNTAGFGGAHGIPDKVWLDGDLVLLSLCDAIFMVDGWENSSGARNELENAIARRMPVLHTDADVRAFLGV